MLVLVVVLVLVLMPVLVLVALVVVVIIIVVIVACLLMWGWPPAQPKLWVEPPEETASVGASRASDALVLADITKEAERQNIFP